LKTWERKWKLALIEHFNRDWRDFVPTVERAMGRVASWMLAFASMTRGFILAPMP
jgi:hypothetical protein